MGNSSQKYRGTPQNRSKWLPAEEEMLQKGFNSVKPVSDSTHCVMPKHLQKCDVKQLNGSGETEKHQRSNDTRKWAKNNSRQLP